MQDGLAAGVAERPEDVLLLAAGIGQQVERLVGVGGDDDGVVFAPRSGAVLHRDPGVVAQHVRHRVAGADMGQPIGDRVDVRA